MDIGYVWSRDGYEEQSHGTPSVVECSEEKRDDRFLGTHLWTHGQ